MTWKLGRKVGALVLMLQVAVFTTLLAAAGVVCWLARKPAVPLAFAVLFAVDGAYQAMAYAHGGHASLSAFAAIAFCGLAWVLDRLSPET